jgi:porin
MLNNRLIVLVLFVFSWIKPALSQEKFSDGIDFSTSVTGDFIINFNGGIKKGFTFIGKEDLNFGLNTTSAGLWENGYLFIHGLNTHGQGPSEKLTGDLQVLSNIEAGDHTGLFEFWYSQQFGKFSVLLGQHDMNTVFLGSKYSSILVNSSFGLMPSISLNMPISIFPLAAPGFIIMYETDKNVTYKFGIYDGNPGSFEDNRYNLNVRLSPMEGFFNIAEIHYIQNEKDREIGNYKIGAYYHTGSFPDYTDTTKTTRGNYGIYLLADKALFPRAIHAGRGLCLFFQSGITNPNSNMIKMYLGGGIRYHGLLPERYKDQLGLGFAHISLSKDYLQTMEDALSFETALEATYIFRFGSNFMIQPCMQYVINPGAIKGNDNCLIGLMRFSISY